MRQSPDPPTPPLPPDPYPGQLFTYVEAAQILRVHPRTVRAWADEGRLTRVPLGPQTLRVTAASVDALIAGHVATTA